MNLHSWTRPRRRSKTSWTSHLLMTLDRFVISSLPALRLATDSSNHDDFVGDNRTFSPILAPYGILREPEVSTAEPQSPSLWRPQCEPSPPISLCTACTVILSSQAILKYRFSTTLNESATEGVLLLGLSRQGNEGGPSSQPH